MKNSQATNDGIYPCKLLEPAWAGELSGDELAYIKSMLKSSPSLRQRWGFRPSAKRFPAAYIRHVAMYGLNAFENVVFISEKPEKVIANKMMKGVMNYNN